MLDKWDKRFLVLAGEIAEWSKDPSTKVGCIIVDNQRRIVGTGYNGFPRGVSDYDYRLDDREEKYLFVQHAEINAVLSSVAQGVTAYVTHHPCSQCAGSLIQYGIKRVVTVAPSADLFSRFEKSFSAATVMFDEAKINLVVYGS